MVKKKICFFCSIGSFDTGLPISTYKLIKHFSSLTEYEVSVILPSKDELFARIKSFNVRIACIPFFRIRSIRHFQDFLKFWMYLPNAFLQVILFFKKNHIDLVHFSDIIDFPFYPCAYFAKAASITHIRIAINNSLARVLYVKFLRQFIGMSICISQFIQTHYRLPNTFSRVIYNPGPDVALFDYNKNYSHSLNIDTNKIIVGTISKFLKIKGHTYFLDMAHTIESIMPGTIQYVIVGNTEPGHEEYFQSICSRVETLGLTDKVTILTNEPYEHIPAILSQMSIFVHTSIVPEGLGGVVLEAMAMRLPIVAFDSGAVKECFTNNLSGFLVPQGNSAAAADKVLRLTNNPALRNSMGANGLQELSRKFSYSKHFSEIDKLYTDYFFSKQ